MILSAIKLTGLLVSVGAPLFFILVCPLKDRNDSAEMLHRWTSQVALTAGGLYLFFVLLSAILDYLHSHQLFLSVEYLNFILVPIFIGCFIKMASLHKAYMYVGLLVSGLVILIVHTTISHAAAGQIGFFPYASNVIHLIAAAIWGGGLIAFTRITTSILKGNTEEFKPLIRQLAIRFSNLVIIMFLILLVSGAILTVSNVHSIAAVNATLYGSGLKLKLVLVLILLGMFIFDLQKKGGRLNKIIDTNSKRVDILLSRFRKFIVIMSFTVVCVILTTGAMTTFAPPDTPPFLTPQTWMLNVGQYPVRIEMRPVAGSSNSVRFELFVPDEAMQPPGMLANYDLYIPESTVGVRDAEAIQVSQNSFQGEATFPMPGSWRLELKFSQPGRDLITGSYNLEISPLPLVKDLKTYLSYSSIIYNSSNKITFIVGVFLLLTYSWLTQHSRSGKIPGWITVVGLVGIVIGIYLVMSVTLVKTYPSTHWVNLQPYNSSSISEGQVIYMDYCSECHGQAGHGDGPWAIENRGYIPSLSSPHMDIHTDGEIYWWVTNGIPSLEMPPLREEIMELDRWAIINYIRSLRHGIPP